MAVLKRSVDSSAKGFASYAGDDPKPGVYRARLIQGAIRAKSTGRLAYNWLFELEAVKPQHKQYDGYSGFCEILLGEEEWAQAKEGAFVKAITGKENFKNVNVAFTGKEDDFKTDKGAPMTAFDGVKIANRIVNIDLRMERERTVDGTTYPAALRANGILPWAKPADSDDEDDIDDLDEDDENQDGTEPTDEEQDEAEGEEGEEMSDEEWEAAKEARRVELKSRAFGLDKLKEALTAQGVDVKGMKKPEMVDALIELEFPEDEEGDEDEEAPAAAITENDVESDEDDDDEDEDEEDEDDDDEEEEDEEEDLEAQLRADAADLDRAALKREIKAVDEAAGFKKSETDDDLRERYVALKLATPGF